MKLTISRVHLRMSVLGKQDSARMMSAVMTCRRVSCAREVTGGGLRTMNRMGKPVEIAEYLV